MVKIALLSLVSVMLTACLVVVDTDSRSLHTTWDEADASRLQLGVSNKDWVSTTFGNPSSKLSYADGTESWKYRNRAKKETEVGLFLIFSMDTEEERTETLTIEFTDALVTNYWIEEDRF
jgi:hypothetical protein